MMWDMENDWVEEQWEAVTPSEPALALLRSISRAKFAYAPAKSLCEAAGGRLIDDEPQRGYVRFEIPLSDDADARRPLIVLTENNEKPQRAFVPLFYFDDDQELRSEFDEPFRMLVKGLTDALGPPTDAGDYRYAHRVGWSYLFSGWSLQDATLILVQDEFDIQFGMDVTLWAMPAGTPIEAPVFGTD
jgi:hypothetical protein